AIVEPREQILIALEQHLARRDRLTLLLELPFALFSFFRLERLELGGLSLLLLFRELGRLRVSLGLRQRGLEDVGAEAQELVDEERLRRARLPAAARGPAVLEQERVGVLLQDDVVERVVKLAHALLDHEL